MLFGICRNRGVVRQYVARIGVLPLDYGRDSGKIAREIAKGGSRACFVLELLFRSLTAEIRC